jgi:peroxiredoxin Q/BCP
MTLRIGSPAPAISLADHEGTIRSLADFRGSWTVVYFYPKDDTPGCTTEACAFRDAYADLEKEGIAVVGISPDSVESHAAFAAKHRLPFTLLADPAKNAIMAYGAWGERSMYGKKYMGVLRSSVLVDPEGNVAKTYPKASPAEHAGEILADVRALRS